MKLPFEARAIRERFRLDNSRRRFLECHIAKGGVGAEIGVFKGNFTPILLEVTQAKRLHLIDPWYLLGAKWAWARGNKSTTDALCSIIRRFRSQLSSGRVVLNISDDLAFLPTLPDRYFDWVYLDSTHSFDQTRKELEMLNLKVKPGGVIAGDDWRENPGHQHHGVCRAVRDFVLREPYEIVYSSIVDKQWAIRARADRDDPIAVQ
jgi:hypothetical protein